MTAAPFLLVDTAAYYALADRSDRHHQAAVRFIRGLTTPLATTNLIVVETLNLMKARFGSAHAIRFGRRLWNRALTPVFRITEADEAEAWRIFQRYADKGFSFTDCTTFALMDRLGARAAFTFDCYFLQYGLQALPGD